nr:Ig-like domain-containing protein [Nakamurella flavida]
MSQVRFDEDSRVVDIFAKAGKDITPADGDPVDLAQGATATATFSAPNRGPGNAVDGTTINEPFWGTAGSPNAQDSLEIDLGSPRTFDDIRVHFYRSSTTGTVAGYATPSLYQLEYQDGATWKAVPGQLRTPTVPRANLNEAAFAPVTAGRIRVTVQHAPGARTAIKEVVVSSTGQDVQAPGNQAPVVDAVASDPRPDGSLALTGTVQDDALPTGTLSSTWSVVSAPEGGSALFADPAAASTSVKFTAEGEYVLRLTATDGALTTSRDITVTGAVAGAAGVNVAPLATPTAEYTAGWNNVRAVNDGEVLNTGGQQNQLWGTWSGARPATRWLQYDWTSPVRVASTEVAFWHDSPGGTGDGVAVPASWKLQYRNAAGEWADVSNASGYGIADTGSNRTSFDPVTTTGLRAVFTANSNGTSNSAIAVSEWSVRTDVPVSTGAVHVPTTVGVVPTLPGTVEQVYSDGSRVQSAVTWPTITAEQVASPGTSFTVTGVVDGGGTATATVWVRVTDAVQINTLAPVTVTTAVGVAPSLPGTVTGVYNDGSQDSRLAVTWDAVPASAYAQAGTFEVSGAVAGTDKRATATVTVAGGGGQPVDTTKPVVSVSPSPAEPSGADGWWTAPVQVTVAAADDVDAAPKVEIDSGSGWVAYTEPVTVGEGTSTVQARATDAAGNVSDVASVSVKVDATVPTVSAAVDGRTVTLTGADTGSGVASVEYRWGAGEWAAYTGPVTAQGSEAATVSFRATDAAGNVSAVGTAEVAAVAVTATVALRSNGVLSAAGWYDQPVLVTVTTPAGTSGVSAQYRINTGSWNTYRSPFTVSTNGDNAVATRLIQDGAVVAGSESVTQVRVDNRAPVAIATRNPQSGTGSPRNPVEMTVTGTDAASGVDRTEYRVDGGEWAAVSAPVVFHQVGTFLVSSRAVDRAGNVSAVRSTTVVIRADVPTSVKATATRVAAGGFTTLVIAGFDRWDSLAVASGELALGPVSSDVNGAARKTVQIPAGTAKGAFPVTVTGTDGTTATVTLTITG